MAHGRQPQPLFPRRCGKNFVSIPFEQRLLEAQDGIIVIDAKNDFLGGARRNHFGLLLTSGPKYEYLKPISVKPIFGKCDGATRMPTDG
jgi:hypothetical protein